LKPKNSLKSAISRSQRGVVGVNEHFFCWAFARPGSPCRLHHRIHSSVGLRRRWWIERNANRCRGHHDASGNGDAAAVGPVSVGPDADTHARTDANADTHSYADADSHTDADTHSYTHAHADSYAPRG